MACIQHMGGCCYSWAPCGCGSFDLDASYKIEAFGQTKTATKAPGASSWTVGFTIDRTTFGAISGTLLVSVTWPNISLTSSCGFLFYVPEAGNPAGWGPQWISVDPSDVDCDPFHIAAIGAMAKPAWAWKWYSPEPTDFRFYLA